MDYVLVNIVLLPKPNTHSAKYLHNKFICTLSSIKSNYLTRARTAYFNSYFIYIKDKISYNLLYEKERTAKTNH